MAHVTGWIAPQLLAFCFIAACSSTSRSPRPDGAAPDAEPPAPADAFAAQPDLPTAGPDRAAPDLPAASPDLAIDSAPDVLPWRLLIAATTPAVLPSKQLAAPEIDLR